MGARTSNKKFGGPRARAIRAFKNKHNLTAQGIANGVRAHIRGVQFWLAGDKEPNDHTWERFLAYAKRIEKKAA